MQLVIRTSFIFYMSDLWLSFHFINCFSVWLQRFLDDLIKLKTCQRGPTYRLALYIYNSECHTIISYLFMGSQYGVYNKMQLITGCILIQSKNFINLIKLYLSQKTLELITVKPLIKLYFLQIHRSYQERKTQSHY